MKLIVTCEDERAGMHQIELEIVSLRVVEHGTLIVQVDPDPEAEKLVITDGNWAALALEAV